MGPRWLCLQPLGHLNDQQCRPPPPRATITILLLIILLITQTTLWELGPINSRLHVQHVQNSSLINIQKKLLFGQRIITSRSPHQQLIFPGRMWRSGCSPPAMVFGNSQIQQLGAQKDRSKWKGHFPNEGWTVSGSAIVGICRSLIWCFSFVCFT